MTYKCGECGKVHDELSRAIMWRHPEDGNGHVLDVHHDRKSMCRSDSQYFVHCEVEVPIVGEPGSPLTFICGVEVSSEDYQRLLVFRQDEDARSFASWVSGRLANPVSVVDDTFGTAVQFEVLKGDPTPYVKWVDPGSSLSRSITGGVSRALWHKVVGA
jgi:hypothetical protein